MTWWTGKGYGISTIVDVTGRPLLTYQGPEDKKPFLISDRVAQTFDFTIRQSLTAGAMKNDRMDASVSSFVKTKLGGLTDDELDHKISLELGGSNTPANLWIQHGITVGASAASDELENTLALDVVAGRKSLLEAWRILADQKGFLLGEDTQLGTTMSFTQIASALWQTGIGIRASKKNTGLKLQNTALKAQMASDIEKLKQNPLNQYTQQSLFGGNVSNAQTVLSITGKEAGAVTKSFIGAYANEKGIDPREINSALNLNIQKIIDNSKTNPNIFGISTQVAINMVAVLQSVSTVAVTAGVVLAIVGICIAGPEAIVGALSGGLLESIGAIFGVSTLTGMGLTSFAFGEAMTVASIGLGMTIKQTYDNVYLLPTQQISSLKEAIAMQKGMSAFLPSMATESTATTSTAKTTTTASSSSGSAGGSTVAQVKVFTGIVSQGVIGSTVSFSPMENGIISSVSDLQNSAQNNLASFVAALPGKITYDIKIVSSVKTSDGMTRVASSQQVLTGYTTAGVAKYKTVINKWAICDIYVLTDKGTRTKITTIILGPTDSVKLQPTSNSLASLSLAVQSNLTTSNVVDITGIQTSNPITITTPGVVSSQQVKTETSLPNTSSQQTVPAVSSPASTTQTPASPAVHVDTGIRAISSGGFTDNFGNYFTSLTVAQAWQPGQPASVAGSDGKTAVIVTPTVSKIIPAGVYTAQTLSEFYTAIGQTIPSLSSRATLYANFGLGITSLYVGSAEQNTNLLVKLQNQYING